MTELSRMIKYHVHSSNITNQPSLLTDLANRFTRISVKPKEDFNCTYEITATGLTIHLAPTNEYGQFIMRLVHEAEVKEGLEANVEP